MKYKTTYLYISASIIKHIYFYLIALKNSISLLGVLCVSQLSSFSEFSVRFAMRWFWKFSETMQLILPNRFMMHTSCFAYLPNFHFWCTSFFYTPLNITEKVWLYSTDCIRDIRLLVNTQQARQVDMECTFERTVTSIEMLLKCIWKTCYAFKSNVFNR